jgi:hypothetical protein
MIHLTEEQRQAVQAGEAVMVPAPEIGGNVVLLREERYRKLRELAEDEQLHEAWLEAVDEARSDWAHENPYEP